MVDCGVEVEKYRQVYLFLGVKKLVFETKTLDLVEVKTDFLWMNLIYGASYWLVASIEYFVESQRRFTCVYDKTCGFRLKLPWDLIFSMRHKHNFVFSKDAHVFCLSTVVSSVVTHCKAHSLAYHIIKRYG